MLAPASLFSLPPLLKYNKNIKKKKKKDEEKEDIINNMMMILI